MKTRKKLKIHFVCLGNTFRSRLAEAYGKYLTRKRNNIVITSSGILASENKLGPISWVALLILQRNKLIKYMSNNWTQTSMDKLEQQDFIVFMDKEVFNLFDKKFDVHKIKKYSVFDIGDVRLSEIFGEYKEASKADAEFIKLVGLKFEKIKNAISKLFSDLKIKVKD